MIAAVNIIGIDIETEMAAQTQGGIMILVGKDDKHTIITFDQFTPKGLVGLMQGEPAMFIPVDKAFSSFENQVGSGV
jgi:hypothetical protein